MSASPELDRYIENLDTLIRKLSPAERRRLAGDIGRQIRQVNKRRIQANIEPSGDKMRRRKNSKSYLDGYRRLRSNEKLPIGKDFIYDGPYTRHPGEIRRLVSLKTTATDARYGDEWRTGQSGNRYRRRNYDPKYVEGYALVNGQSPGAAGGVSKFNRQHIYVPGGSKRIREKLMFRKIHQYKFLKLQATEHAAAVGFMTGLVGSIAAGHQYGLENRPTRVLLGFSSDDLLLIEETVVRYLAEIAK